MIENAHPGKGRKVTPGKLQKKHSWEMKELKMHDMENERMENAQHEKGRKCTYWKMTENHNCKMKECKMHDMEKGRKCTPRKMTEKSQPENARHRKCTT